MSDETQACEVPLIEQLRSVPADYRAVRAIQWDEDGHETGHQFIPVGFMMHRAADALEATEREREAIKERCATDYTDMSDFSSLPECIKSAIRAGIEAWKRQQTEIPLCGNHARTWFTERNHLTAGMLATCVVCAHQPSASLRTSETMGEK